MRNTKLTMARKLRIIEHTRTTGNVKASARKFRVQPSQIRRWRTMKSTVQSAAEANPAKRTTHSGMILYIYQWKEMC